MALKDKENDVDLPSDVMSTLKDLEEHMDGYDFIRYGIKIISDEAYRLAREKCYLFHLCRDDIHKTLSKRSGASSYAELEGTLVQMAFQSIG